MTLRDARSSLAGSSGQARRDARSSLAGSSGQALRDARSSLAGSSGQARRDARSSLAGSSGQALRDDALAALRGWRAPASPDQDRQVDLRARFVDHLERTADGMWRSSYPDHLTAGALVIDEAGERVLLNLHRKARRWFAFGGHAEPGDVTLADVAAREAREESGIADLQLVPVPAQLDVHSVPFCDPRGAVRHLDVRYVAVAPASAREVTSDESLAVKWWPVGGLPELEPSMIALVGLARALVR